MKLALSGTGVLALAAIAGVGLVAWKLNDSLPAVGDKLRELGQAVNPFNPDNVVATGVNTVVSAATGRDETLGGWLYDVTHADPFSAGSNTSTAGGTQNNPSAYTAPSGQGGAAFGIYPRP
jgi:hypothetical protein